MIIDAASELKITIPGQPATKKNSSILVKGKSLVLPSKAYTQYCKAFHKALRDMGELPHFDGPVQLTARYYLRDRRSYPDLNGLIQATQDILSDEYGHKNHKKVLKKRWVLGDDRQIKSLDGCRIAGIDKDNPRTEIYIKALDIDIKTETDPQLVKKAKELAQTRLAI